ncbi:MAG: hypothetical protein BWY83_02443 [bacterium ADurb.Bin478]|nr:MAG: hypothetical protein BWY83_02443 [bacterium ADurb.Bin478]
MTWRITAQRVTRRQRKPSQMEAPKIAGMEMKYLNRSSKLPTKVATQMPPTRVMRMAIRPMLR